MKKKKHEFTLRSICESTCDLMSTTAPSISRALVPQRGHLPLQHLQPAQKSLQVFMAIGATTGLLGDVDAVGEDDLVLPVHRVVGGAKARERGCVSGIQLAAPGGIQVGGAKGAGGDVDVVDVVEHHRLVRAGQGDVAGSGLCQGGSSMPKHLLH